MATADTTTAAGAGETESAADVVLPGAVQLALTKYRSAQFSYGRRSALSDGDVSDAADEFLVLRRTIAAALAAHATPSAGESEPVWRPVLRDLLREYERNICTHEETHRGGAIWTICDGCDRKWADDEGGFVPYSPPAAVVAAEALLAAAPPAPAPSGGNGSLTCAARKANIGANDPQECDWPVCGCDPHADKVIAALQESGLLSPDPRGGAPAPSGGDGGTLQADLRELLTILGMGDHARPQSPHEVFQEALGVLRSRLVQGTDPAEPSDALKAAVWQAIAPFREELCATGGVTFMGLRNAIVAAIRQMSPDPRGGAEAAETALYNDAELEADPLKMIAHLQKQCRDFIKERDEWKAVAKGGAEAAGDLTGQGEPVAWAYEYYDQGGFCFMGLCEEKPEQQPCTRNIRPLYEAPATPRPAAIDLAQASVEWERTGKKKLVRFSADPLCEYDYEWHHLPTGERHYYPPYQDPNGWVSLAATTPVGREETLHRIYDQYIVNRGDMEDADALKAIRLLCERAGMGGDNA